MGGGVAMKKRIVVLSAGVTKKEVAMMTCCKAGTNMAKA